MELNTYLNQVPDAKTRRAFFMMQAGINLLPFNITGGVDYYVEENIGGDSYNGKSWETAFATLPVALAASHANIGASSKGWASRNRIFCKGDFTSNLVLLAQKTDVIGMGSHDSFQKSYLVGNHIPTGVTAAYGTRFFNFLFKAGAAGGDIFTLDDDVLNFNLIDCDFAADSTVVADRAVVSAASWFLKIYGCKYLGAFTDAVIEIGAGNARGTEIIGNYIEGANRGIELSASATTSPEKIMIAENKIHTATECIYDGADIASIMDNKVVTLQAKGMLGAGAIVGNEFLSVGNKMSASDVANCDWPPLGSLS